MSVNSSPSETPPPRAPVQGERKIVTVLFADVVGSTGLAESLDPEDWAEIIAGMHDRVSESITRYDGLVAQLLGDGVLAFFGAPAAHEDDPERAVMAGLDLLSSIGAYETELRRVRRLSQFQMRVGLNSGLVVVGNVGAASHVEYLAVGDTVNLAARLQSAARPGTIVMAASTARAVRHAFVLDALGEIDVKGKVEPVQAYRVVAAKARPESKRGIAGLDSPIIGREREIALLASRLGELAAGKGQIITLMGEAGLGKSRLMAEIVERSPESFVRAEGRCISFAAIVPYLPIMEALAQLLDLPALDDAAGKMDRVRDVLPASVVPFVATLFGLPLGDDESDAIRFTAVTEPARLRERMMDAIASSFEHLAAQQPLALIVEDLHWADPSTLDVLERMLGVTSRAPLAIIAAFRPGTDEPSWRFHEAAGRDDSARYTPILLKPLVADDARALVANLLHIEDLPDSVRALILTKAEGNPFYVEEVIRALLDAQLVVNEDGHWHATREITNIALPDTLAGVITARLDRLDETGKALVQTAAVLGRDFTTRLLAQVFAPASGLDEALEALVMRELIQPRPGDTYRFKHVLIQEAAYNSLLLSKRRNLHRRAAEALAATDGAQPATIAMHFLSAQDALRALPYLVAAGESALGAYSTPEALALFRQAVDIAGSEDDVALARRAFEGLGQACTIAADPVSAIETYEAMANYAVQHGEGPMRVSALNKTAFVQSIWLGQFEPAQARLDLAKGLAHDCGDKAGLAEGLMARCNISTSKAEFEEAVQHLSQLVLVGRELDREFETAFGLVHVANTWTNLARFDRAWPAALQAREFAEQHGDLMHLAQTLGFSLAWSYLSFGDLDAAHAAAAQGAEIATRIGEKIGLSQSRYTLATITRWQGKYAESLEHWQSGLAAAQQFGLPFVIAMMLGGLCGTTIERDATKLSETVAWHEQTFQLMEHPMGVMGGGTAWADIGECALAVGEPARARVLFEKGLTVHTPFMYLHKPRFLLGLAQVALAEGDPAQAQRHAAVAHALAEERKMGWLGPAAALAEADVRVALGQKTDALACYADAETQATAMGMWPAAEQARRGAANIA